MNPITLILIFFIVLLMRWYKSIKDRTHYFPLYSVVTHRRGPATLHMRFEQCPVGKGALEKIFDELQVTLIDMRRLGYKKVKFTSHILRQGTEKKLLQFLINNHMECVYKKRYKTPFIHAISNKLAMRYYKKGSIKVSPMSLLITIRL